MPSEYKPPNIGPQNVLRNRYKPGAYFRDLTVSVTVTKYKSHKLAVYLLKEKLKR